MKQVKEVCASLPYSKLEDELNKWLQENPGKNIVDIKFISYRTAYVIYETNFPKEKDKELLLD